MSMRKVLLAVGAVAAFAFAAMPSIASASPKIDFTGSTHFTVTGGTSELIAGGSTVHCTSVTGTGEFTSGSTGHIEYTFHGCTIHILFTFNCSSEEQPTGTITTGVLPLHLKKHNGAPVVLTTPEESTGEFARFSCAGQEVVVTGSGIVGAITSPGYNEEPSPSFTVSYAEEGGGQAITTTDETGETEWELESSLNGGEPEPAIEIASGTGTFAEGGEGTLTEE